MKEVWRLFDEFNVKGSFLWRRREFDILGKTINELLNQVSRVELDKGFPSILG